MSGTTGSRAAAYQNRITEEQAFGFLFPAFCRPPPDVTCQIIMARYHSTRHVRRLGSYAMLFCEHAYAQRLRALAQARPKASGYLQLLERGQGRQRRPSARAPFAGAFAYATDIASDYGSLLMLRVLMKKEGKVL